MKLKIGHSRSDYRDLCNVESSIPLFSKAWWLDAVCGDEGWHVVLVFRGDQIIGALPYTSRKRLGLRVIGQPKLTQNLGPWVRPSNVKYAKLLGYEKDILQALADNLPEFDHYAQNWHLDRTNWLPFYWRGFKQTTRYTYRINRLIGENAAWESCQEKIRTDVRKATNRFGVSVTCTSNLHQFLEINSKTFSRQGRRVPYSEKIVRRIDSVCQEHGCRRIYIAKDQENRTHAGAYVVWDSDTAYYLMGGGDPALRNSGAGSLCLWEAIRTMPDHLVAFDFEGSMIESVERFIRGFGAVQNPYFFVFKTPSKVLKTYFFIKDMELMK